MKRTIISYLFIGLFLFSCGGNEKSSTSSQGETAKESSEAQEKVEIDPMQNKGIGPIESIEIAEVIDEGMAEKGKEIFDSKCSSCHKPTERFIGPAPKGLLDRRTPEWAMNMILNPMEMVEKDPIAKQLLIEANGAPMANQQLTEEDARQVLEYIRTIE